MELFYDKTIFKEKFLIFSHKEGISGGRNDKNTQTKSRNIL